MFTEPFHKFLAELRRLTGLRQIDLSKQLGLTRQRYGHLENGSRMPSEAERALLLCRFGRCEGYTAPAGLGRRLSDNAKKQRAPVPEFRPAQERTSDLRYSNALKAYPHFVRRTTERIRRRSDFLDCQFHCGQTALESADEVPLLLRLLDAGALPAYYPPLWLGSLRHPIVDPLTREHVGHCKLPCWALPGDFYFFQVTLSTPKYYRVDVLRWNGSWSVLEVDGKGHNGSLDAARTEALGIPVRRLTPTEIISDGFSIPWAA
jgi:transcriptional regulator with XRE-family HTH domain